MSKKRIKTKIPNNIRNIEFTPKFLRQCGWSEEEIERRDQIRMATYDDMRTGKLTNENIDLATRILKQEEVKVVTPPPEKK